MLYVRGILGKLYFYLTFSEIIKIYVKKKRSQNLENRKLSDEKKKEKEDKKREEDTTKCRNLR